MRRVLLSLLAAAFVLLLTSCADPSASTNDPGSPTTVPPSSSAPVTTTPPKSTVPVPPGPPAGTPPASGRRIVVEGIVESGVEPGCKVISTATGQYLLLGDVPLGVEVRVTGVAATGVSTTCQQGTPLRVVSVQRR
jgi:hypothetical protein